MDSLFQISISQMRTPSLYFVPDNTSLLKNDIPNIISKYAFLSKNMWDKKESTRGFCKSVKKVVGSDVLAWIPIYLPEKEKESPVGGSNP